MGSNEKTKMVNFMIPLKKLLILSTSIFFIMAQPGRIYSKTDELFDAYRILKNQGEYEKKKKALEVFSKNYNNMRAISMIMDLLTYNYDNPDFREDDQKAYYDDVIAEGLIEILARSRHPSAFPALLRIVLYENRHREATIKAAWRAIKEIDWSKK